MLAVVALGAGVLYASTGGVGQVAGMLSSAVGGFVDDLTATPVITPEPAVISDSPSLEKPVEPYTNVAAVDLVGRLPSDIVGRDDHILRLYVAVGDGEASPFKEVPVGETPQFVVPGVALTLGYNTFTATIVGPAGESEHSPEVIYVLDQSTPKITLAAPADGAVVNRASVDLSGKTQARSKLIGLNTSTGASVQGEAGMDGQFALAVPINTGTNDITLEVTDPAGNKSSTTVTVRRGTGALTANLTASAQQIKASKLPEKIELRVSVTDPDGRALQGAKVVFNLTIAGVPPVSSKPLTTSSRGIATWSTTVPKGAAVGQGGLAVVVVTAKNLGDTTDRTVITVVK